MSDTPRTDAAESGRFTSTTPMVPADIVPAASGCSHELSHPTIRAAVDAARKEGA